tara:strand:+ start:118 stop:528 length:411 start_codon:yes stop_codon:yes gene_type:complete
MISMPNPTAVLPRATESFEAWYDAKSEDEQLLIDEINDRINKGFDEQEYEQFIKLLRDDIGIITADNLCDALFYETDAFHAEEEFAEYLFTEFGCRDIPSEIQGCIDWQLVWNTAYRFDFSSVEFSDITYFFHNNF